MNSAVKLALAGAMSIASLSGVALAQNADPVVDPSATTGSTTSMDDGVSVVTLSSLKDEGTGMRTRLMQLSTDESAMAKAQAEVSGDAAMTQALQEKSIDMTNVIFVDTAANGGKTIYVR